MTADTPWSAPEDDTAPEVEPWRILGDRPETVSDAFDLHVRLTALMGWIADRRDDVVDWTRTRAEDRRAEDGAAPTWRLPGGTVVLTDPQPAAAVTDPECFARWYVGIVLGYTLPRDDDAIAGGQWSYDNGRVVLVPTARASSEVLLSFVAAYHDGHPIEAATELAEHLTVRWEFYVGEDLLDDLLTGQWRALDDGSPRFELVEDAGYVVDRGHAHGEIVPGLTVTGRRPGVVQFRPSRDVRQRVRAELDALLGPSALHPPMSGDQE